MSFKWVVQLPLGFAFTSEQHVYQGNMTLFPSKLSPTKPRGGERDSVLVTIPLTSLAKHLGHFPRARRPNHTSLFYDRARPGLKTTPFDRILTDFHHTSSHDRRSHSVRRIWVAKIAQIIMSVFKQTLGKCFSFWDEKFYWKSQDNKIFLLMVFCWDY